MSWSINGTGTVSELRDLVHEHAKHYWKHLPLSERLIVNHAIGHCLEIAEEHIQSNGAIDQKFVLDGWGHQYNDETGAGFNMNLNLSKLTQPTTES